MQRFFILLLSLLTVVAVIAIVANGYDYYSLSLVDRPHNALHTDWKSGGFVGHGIGILGGVLLVSLLAYWARKQFRWMHRWGNLRNWLNFHIWMGITGPILITFHSTFKVGGIIAIAFWAMVAVALSGFVGRYLYLQIPRNLAGNELSESELDDMDSELTNQIKASTGDDASVEQIIKQAEGGIQKNVTGLWGNIVYWIRHDLLLRFKLRDLKANLTSNSRLAQTDVDKVVELVRRRALLERKVKFLKTAQTFLHQWHTVHRPFAMVMFIIVAVHVVVTVMFGYRWVF